MSRTPDHGMSLVKAFRGRHAQLIASKEKERCKSDYLRRLSAQTGTVVLLTIHDKADQTHFRQPVIDER